jgi:hypothetical protein
MSFWLTSTFFSFHKTKFWISKSNFEFRSRILNFEVKFWISKLSFEFRSGVLNFEIEFWISKSNFEFRSRVLNFEFRMSLLGFRIKRVKNYKLDENNWVVGSIKWVVGRSRRLSSFSMTNFTKFRNSLLTHSTRPSSVGLRESSEAVREFPSECLLTSPGVTRKNT